MSYYERFRDTQREIESRTGLNWITPGRHACCTLIEESDDVFPRPDPFAQRRHPPVELIPAVYGLPPSCLPLGLDVVVLECRTTALHVTERARFFCGARSKRFMKRTWTVKEICESWRQVVSGCFAGLGLTLAFHRMPIW